MKKLEFGARGIYRKGIFFVSYEERQTHSSQVIIQNIGKMKTPLGLDPRQSNTIPTKQRT